MNYLKKYLNYLLTFKDVFKNFSYTLIYQILALILPIVTVPYITRILNQELIGLNSVVQANCSYFELIGMLGITLLGPREIAKCLGDKDKLSNTFFSIYKIQFISHAFVIILYVLYVLIFFKYKLALFYIIYLLAYMFDISWLFIGLEDFKSVTIRNVFIRIVGFILLITCVKRDNDIYVYVLTLYIPQIIMNVYMWYFALKKCVNFKIIKTIDKLYITEAISLLLPQIASSIYTLLDKTVLGIFSTYTQTAIYTQGQVLLQLFYAIVPSFCKVMSPRISNCIKRNSQEEVYRYMKMSCHVICFISFLFFWGLLACAKLFVTWYLPENYIQVTDVLMLCSPIILMVSGANLISIEFLIPLGQQRKYTNSIVIAAGLNLMLNLTLTPMFGLYGVCIASVMAESVGFGIQLLYARHYIRLEELFSGTTTYFISGLTMFIILKSISPFIEASFFNIVGLALFGASLYIIFIFIFKKIFNIFLNKSHI